MATFISFREPVPSDLLDDLDKNVDKVSSEEDRIKVLAILFRYRKPRGEVGLKDDLRKNGNLFAAAALASAHKEEVVGDVVSALLSAYRMENKLPEEERTGAPWFLLETLGQWQDSRIGAALAKSLDYAPRDMYLVMANACRMKKNTAEQLLQKRRTLKFTKDAGDDALRCAYDLSMVKLGVMPASDCADLTADLNSETSERIAVVIGEIKFLRLVEGKDYLERVVSKCKGDLESTHDKSRPRIGLLLDAVLAMNEIDSERARVVAEWVLTNRKVLNLDERYLKRIGVVLVGDEKTRNLLTDSVGDDWVRNMEAVSSLTQLPEYYFRIEKESFEQMFPTPRK